MQKQLKRFHKSIYNYLLISLIAVLPIMCYAITKENIALLSKPINWQTYKDSTYGFIIHYPKNIKIQNDFNNTNFPTYRWSADENIDSNTGIHIINIPIFQIKNAPHYPRFFTTELSVGVSQNKNDVDNCTKGSTLTMTINGTTFYEFDISDAGMMKYIIGKSYRTVHNNQCYAVEQIAAGSSYRDKPSRKDISDDSLKQYYHQIDPIIQTFTFISK